MHKSIQLKQLGLSFPHKICFDAFDAQVSYGARIAVIGRNGSGKSSLLKMLAGLLLPTEGEIMRPADISLAYIPQILDDKDPLSGGQRFNQALTRALSQNPSLLLLDEPTNHLDSRNRRSLMRMLRVFPGTLIIVSHDVELLRNGMDTLWAIEPDGQITQFSGGWDDYRREMQMKRSTAEHALSRLNRQKKDAHQSLMKEQQRAASSRAKGEKSISQRKWPTIVSAAKVRRGQETSGHKKAELRDKKQVLMEQLDELRQPEIIVPGFALSSADSGTRCLVSVSEGQLAYADGKTLVHDIHLSIHSGERVAIAGANGSGKSTLLKALLQDPDVLTTGNWLLPRAADLGYLDQHYATLTRDLSVLDNMQNTVPTWTHAELRKHLNDFLFRKNEEINALVSSLSGGEKARLSLAQIAARPPKLLILDEMTNNLDLETREHVIQVLRDYPGAMLVVSHDEDFLAEIGVLRVYRIEGGTWRAD